MAQGLWGLVPLFSVIVFGCSSVIYGDSYYLLKKKTKEYNYITFQFMN
jgi:hypothetical protein